MRQHLGDRKIPNYEQKFLQSMATSANSYAPVLQCLEGEKRARRHYKNFDTLPKERRYRVLS